MAQTITVSFEELLSQAHSTASGYLDYAIRDIDRRFGEGFAKKNPELIAAFVNAAAADYGAAIISQQLRLGLDAIAEAVQQVANREG